jgi:pyridinium-3,5-bisthiocarboxylic acid mononucleotide nickel chelatase
MKILYCDCFSGISGDMFLSALLDAGLPVDYLLSRLQLLNLPEPFKLSVARVHKGPIAASQISIEIDPSHHSHSRNLEAIRAIIAAAPLSEKVIQTSLAVFQRLAEAEAQVHGAAVEEVHFHEVGAVDSIIDTVGAALALEFLGIERVYASALPMGSGQVQSQHGILPLPAPATLELLRQAHARVAPSSAQVELVTPTGAAILATLATFEQPSMTITGLGVGAGRLDLPWPNVLRVVIGEVEAPASSPMVQIETNIDDMNPQLFGHLMNHLLSAGALDVYFTPIQMKKNRPATMLGVIARREDETSLARLILEETSTLGMRVIPVYRFEAERRIQTVHTEYGEVPLKLKIMDGKVIQASPEYEVCLRLAEEQQVPLIQVYTAALSAGKALI